MDDERPQQAEKVHHGIHYDVGVDTSSTSVAEVAEKVHYGIPFGAVVDTSSTSVAEVAEQLREALSNGER